MPHYYFSGMTYRTIASCLFTCADRTVGLLCSSQPIVWTLCDRPLVDFLEELPPVLRRHELRSDGSGHQ